MHVSMKLSAVFLLAASCLAQQEASFAAKGDQDYYYLVLPSDELEEEPQSHVIHKRGLVDVGGGLDHGAAELAAAGGAYGHAHAVPISQTVEVTKPVAVPVIKHVGVHVPHPVPVAVPHPIAVPVPQPYPVAVHVPQPVAVPVVRTIAIPVEKPVPYPVERPVPYPVERPVPVHIEKHIPIPVPKPYPVTIPIVKHIHHYAKGGWH